MPDTPTAAELVERMRDRIEAQETPSEASILDLCDTIERLADEVQRQWDQRTDDLKYTEVQAAKIRELETRIEDIRKISSKEWRLVE